MELISQDAKQQGNPVDEDQRSYLWHQRHSNANVGACCGYLLSRLLGMGFSYVSLEGKLPSDALAAHVRKYFVPFAKEALEQMLVQGLAVYTIIPIGKNSSLPIPVVCDPSTYELSVKVSKHGQRVVVVRPKTIKCKTKIHCLDMPVASGTLCSRLALVSAHISQLDEIEKNDAQAFTIRCKPPVLTRTKTDSTFDSRDVVSGGINGLRGQEESDNMGVRNEITVEQLLRQETLIRRLNQSRVDTSSPFWTNSKDPQRTGDQLNKGADEYIPRFVPLPNDTDVASFDLPQERKDLVAMQKFVKSQICMGMGVPENFMTPSTGGAGSGEKSLRLTNEFVRISLSPLKDSLKTLMLEVYADCFLGAKDPADGHAPKADKGDNKVQETIDCYFPSMQNPEVILDLYREGIISKKALARTVGPVYDLEDNDILFGVN